VFVVLAHFWTAQKGRSIIMASNITEQILTNDILPQDDVSDILLF